MICNINETINFLVIDIAIISIVIFIQNNITGENFITNLVKELKTPPIQLAAFCAIIYVLYTYSNIEHQNNSQELTLKQLADNVESLLGIVCVFNSFLKSLGAFFGAFTIIKYMYKFYKDDND